MDRSHEKPKYNLTLSTATLGLFLAWTGYELWLTIGDRTGEAHFATFLLLALAATVISEMGALPGQNVFAAAMIILVVGAVVELISAFSGIPFGTRIFLERAGSQIFGALPWSLPLIWVLFVLNSRAVARLILRPWRKSKSYGFRVIGLTCLLTIAMRLNFEPLATRVNHFWVCKTRVRRID